MQGADKCSDNTFVLRGARSPPRWQTEFGRWVSDFGVSDVVDALAHDPDLCVTRQAVVSLAPRSSPTAVSSHGLRRDLRRPSHAGVDLSAPPRDAEASGTDPGARDETGTEETIVVMFRDLRGCGEDREHANGVQRAQHVNGSF